MGTMHNWTRKCKNNNNHNNNNLGEAGGYEGRRVTRSGQHSPFPKDVFLGRKHQQ